MTQYIMDEVFILFSCIIICSVKVVGNTTVILNTSVSHTLHRVFFFSSLSQTKDSNFSHKNTTVTITIPIQMQHTHII